MKRTLVCIAMIVGLLASAGLADEKERKGDRRKGRREAARKSTSANQPRGERQRARRAPKKNKARTDVLIYQFKHIHVDSFINTLEQLARSKHIAPHLKDVPHAVNEQSNTMVMLAPTELTTLVKQIAEGVDKPNPREMRRRGENREQSRRRPMVRFGVRRSCGEGECPMMKRSGGGKPPRAGRDDDEEHDRKNGRRGDRRKSARPTKGRRHTGPATLDVLVGRSGIRMREGARFGDQSNRRGDRHSDAKGSQNRRPAMIGMLLHPRLAGAIKLNEKQVDKIRDVVKDLHSQMEQLSKRVANARKDARSETARRQLQTNARRRIMQLHKEAREKIDKILTDEQKEQWRKMGKTMHPRRRGQDGDRRANRRSRRDDDDGDDDERRNRRGRRSRHHDEDDD
jgi:outer membrane murein-binding lipoprotein Lpp